jgi:hypothetical protein
LSISTPDDAANERKGADLLIEAAAPEEAAAVKTPFPPTAGFLAPFFPGALFFGARVFEFLLVIDSIPLSVNTGQET